MDFQSLIRKDLGESLHNRGFKVVRQESDDKAFGNALLIFASNELRIRLVKDRSDILIEVGPLSGEERWFDFWLVHQLITGVSKLKTKDENPDLMAMLRVTLNTMYDVLCQLFSPPFLEETMRKIKQMNSAQVQTFLRNAGMRMTSCGGPVSVGTIRCGELAKERQPSNLKLWQ